MILSPRKSNQLALLYVFKYALEDTEDSSGGDTWIIPPPPPPRSPLARYDPRNAAGEQPEAVRSFAEEKVRTSSRESTEELLRAGGEAQSEDSTTFTSKS